MQAGLAIQSRLQVKNASCAVSLYDVRCCGLSRITFDDLHNTGLYTWDYLYELSNNKFNRAKQYITTLRLQGLSRDPRQPKQQRNGGKGSSSILE
jgi:DUF971 family protein